MSVEAAAADWISPLWALAAACVGVFAATWSATGVVLRLLRRFRVHDVANERSSHSGVTPRGGGLAMLPVLLLAWVVWVFAFEAGPAAAPAGFLWIVAGACLLAAVSLADDLRPLPAATRFIVQILAVTLGIGALGDAGLVFQGLLPPLADRLAAAFVWLWFVNLYNFMDGIDGITGAESIALGLGIATVAWLAGSAAGSLSDGLIVLPLLLAAAAAAFLLWNWSPARLFLGDVGSVPLGYLLGWLLLLLAVQGLWASAVILPLYYLADATLTLLLRGLRGEPVWRAHRQHFYQRAALARGSHAAVVLQISALNAVLLALALFAASGYPWMALGCSLLASAGLLWTLERQARAVA